MKNFYKVFIKAFVCFNSSKRKTALAVSSDTGLLLNVLRVTLMLTISHTKIWHICLHKYKVIVSKIRNHPADHKLARVSEYLLQ